MFAPWAKLRPGYFGLFLLAVIISGSVIIRNSYAASSFPAQVLNLTNWKITLPIDTSHAGTPDEYTQPELNTFSIDPYFRVNSASDGVIFQANAGGATTANTAYPRSELREMTNNGSSPASWSNTSGTHTMVVTEALTAMTLVNKPQVVTAQIHDASNDIIEVMADKVGSKANADGSFGICVRFNGTEQSTCLDNHYVLGTKYVLKLVATGGHIQIYYNGVQKFNFSQSGSGWYFKAGSYVQSNSTTKGLDAPGAYGQVTIYDLQVSHSTGTSTPPPTPPPTPSSPPTTPPTTPPTSTCPTMPTTLGSASSTINVASTATYRIWSRIMAPNSANNSLFLQMDSGCGAVLGDSQSIPANAWTWVNYKDGLTSSYADVALTAGTHTLNVVGRESGVKLDRILFLSDLTCVPTGNGDNCSSGDIVKPVATITSPANGAKVVGTVAVTATASDNVGVTKVDFLVDGQTRTSATSSPYVYNWNSSAEPTGSHTLVVQASDAAGNVGYSTLITVSVDNSGADTQAPTAPGNLTATATIDGGIDLSWTASTDSNGISGYIIKRDGTIIGRILGENVSYTDLNTQPNATYTYVVQAQDPAGNISLDSDTATVTTSTTADAQPPLAPTNLTATASSLGAVDLTWTASTDNVGVAKYTVLRDQVVLMQTVSTSWSDTTTLPGTSYSYTVYATDAAGNNSLASNSVNVTTAQAPSSQTPTAPTNLIATATSSVQVNLEWTPVTDNGGVAGYHVSRDGVRIATVTANTYGDGKVLPNTSYAYSVTAFDAAGNESPAATVNATTPLPPASSNLVRNSTFESGLGGWKLRESTPGGVLKISSTGHNGSHSAQLWRKSGHGDINLNDSPNWASSTTSGTVCTATAWVRGTKNELIKIRLVESKNGNSIGSHTSGVTLPDSSWHKIKVSLPARGGTMDLNVYGRNFASGDKVLIDDVTERCI